MDLAKSHWDTLHSHYTREDIQSDDWLRRFDHIIEQCPGPIIDLGCGSGNDTKYLLALGKQVISCDYAPNAIANIRRNFPEVTAMCFDMTEGLPFDDNFTELLIADLSLHYFSEEVTRSLLNEIKRILTPDGYLLMRLNSVNDVNHGAGEGTELERHFYRTPDGRFKRFFDEEDMQHFFGDWNILSCRESQMDRYALPKQLWTLLTTPNNGSDEGKNDIVSK